MKQFEKVAGRWKGGGFSGEPDYGFADCERSVVRPVSSLFAKRMGRGTIRRMVEGCEAPCGRCPSTTLRVVPLPIASQQGGDKEATPAA